MQYPAFVKKGIPDPAVAAIVALLSVLIVLPMFREWRGPCGSFSNDLLVPSAMFACGRGFVNVAPTEIPGLSEFLNLQSRQFDASRIPSELHPIEPHPLQNTHLYIVYAVGVAWKLFGVNWAAIEALQLALLAVMMAAAYYVFRSGMGRVLSALGTLAYANAMSVDIIGNLRDFSKAPFILIALAFTCSLIRHRHTFRMLLATSLALGIAQGVGFGFRRDVVICIPPAVLAIAFCELAPEGRWRQAAFRRGAAMALMFGAFYVGAFPILGAFAKQGYLGHHDLIMGFSTASDDAMGVGRASYERLYRTSDPLVNTTGISHLLREDPTAQVGPSGYEDTYIRMIFETFPGDMITRAYSALYTILSGNAAVGFRLTIGILCIPIAAAAFAIMAGKRLRLAWSVFFLLFYLCCYTSFQFQSRHVFHLAFAAFWFPLFVADKVLALRWHCVRDFLQSHPQYVAGCAKRVALFAIPALLLILLPLYAARAWQIRQVGQLAGKCAAADLEPMPIVSQKQGEWTLFRRNDSAVCAPGAQHDHQQISTSYWACEYVSSGDGLPIVVRYETLNGYGDFTVQLSADMAYPGIGQKVRCLFPVYEDSSEATWSRLVGIALEEQHASAFKALYRVRNLKDFPLLVTVYLPEDMRLFRRFQDVSFRHDTEEIPRHKWWNDPYEKLLQSASTAQNQGDFEAAGRAYGEILQSDPANLAARMGSARALEQQGLIEEAIQAYRNAADAARSFPTPYAALDSMLSQRVSPRERVDIWTKIVAERADAVYPHYALGRALVDSQDIDAALKAFRAGAALSPCDARTRVELARVLRQVGQTEEADAFCEELHAIQPFVPLAPLGCAPRATPTEH